MKMLLLFRGKHITCTAENNNCFSLEPHWWFASYFNFNSWTTAPSIFILSPSPSKELSFFWKLAMCKAINLKLTSLATDQRARCLKKGARCKCAIRGYLALRVNAPLTSKSISTTYPSPRPNFRGEKVNEVQYHCKCFLSTEYIGTVFWTQVLIIAFSARSGVTHFLKKYLYGLSCIDPWRCKYLCSCLG